MDIFYDQEAKDFVLSGGDIKMVSDLVEQLSQRLYIRLKTFKGELFWDRSKGIDYLNQVFGISRPKTTVDSILQQEILSEPMVSQITSFNSQISNYNYNCTFSVKLKEQEIVITYYILQTDSGMNLLDSSGKVITTRIG